jgi:hypothetical protein
MLDTSTAVSRPAKLRSKLTNDPTLLPGIDRRSSGGRRFLDLAEAIATEYPDASTIAVKELASLQFSLEKVQAAVVAGDIERAEDQVRLANLITRKEKELRAKARKHETERPAVGPREHFARKAAKAFCEPVGGHRENDR